MAKKRQGDAEPETVMSIRLRRADWRDLRVYTIRADRRVGDVVAEAIAEFIRRHPPKH